MGSKAAESKDFPDGLSAEHAQRRGFLFEYRGWFAIVVLAVLIAAALLGAFGGRPAPVREADGARASLAVKAPETLRSGEFFEVRIRMSAREKITEPVLAVAHSYLNDLTLNTIVPTPREEASDGTFYTMAFDPLDAGDSLFFKIDGQVNPALVLGNRGSIELRDGETPLVRLPLELEVRP